jgi:pimeloyl-ACP methyl ester carboxylesterase
MVIPMLPQRPSQATQEPGDRQGCGSPRAGQPVSSPTLQLNEVLQRFEREAVRGRCDTGRYRCSYYTWGEGPPLLFIHGLSDDARSFVLPIALLSRHFRCIAYNLPMGCGDGARLANYRHADLVADVFALLDHLGVPQSYVFASSFGSTIALAALRQCPERLPRAILQGGFVYRPLAPAEILLARAARWWPGPMRWLPFRRQLLHYTHHGPFARRDPDVWEFFLQRWGSPPMAAVARRAVLLHQLDLRPILGAIRQPVLLLCGDADPLVGKKCEEVLLRGLPNVVRVELQDCGHVPFYSHPETLADVTTRFLLPSPCTSVCH